jgi:hypothetical protein
MRRLTAQTVLRDCQAARTRQNYPAGKIRKSPELG